ncbi:MAG: hypothetical protein HRU19_03010 [Pseudobacteriovorax sp.]|nr:hypothetical protein [Pseudobacteriovorax sp.]
MAIELNEAEVLLLIGKRGEGSDEQASKWIDTLKIIGLYDISDIVEGGGQ